MILRRLGNKAGIAKKILPYFPKHRIYIELFFGAGGMFFNKPLAEYNFLNDLDNDVFNCFIVWKEKREELLEVVKSIPYSDSVFNYFKKNKQSDPVWKAARFLVLSNWGYMGRPDSLHFCLYKNRKNLLEKLSFPKFLGKIENKATNFLNVDFKNVLGKISYKKFLNEESKTFIYADPPYLGTGDNYSNSFKLEDSEDLFSLLNEYGNKGFKFAISEFNNPEILELANKYNLNIITIGERQSMKNRNTEILITNYETQNTLF